MIRLLFAFTSALVIAFAITPMVRRLAISLNVMVQPGGRRVHARPMPLWGGIAIYIAVAAVSIFLLSVTSLSHDHKALMTGVLISGTIILIAGLLDDIKELSASVQSFVIITASVILISFGVRIQFLSNPFSDSMIHLPPVLSWAATLLWIFTITKTLDFMDGLDGLASGIGAIASGVLAIMSYYGGQPHVALMSGTLCGACIGFLRFNFNPAKIFMGTGGSQFIGFTLAAISLIGAFKAATAVAIALPVLVLGVPIFDALFVLIKRLVNRQPLHIADKTHIHHRLMDRGLTHRQAVLVLYMLSGLLGLAAVLWFMLSR